MSKKRIGILTSGGDCPGLNAVIRGAVKASRQLGYDCVGFLKGYEGLYDPVQYVHLTADSTRGILNQGGTILGSTNKGRFAATVGVSDRKELDPALVEGVKQTIAQLGIDGLICVGGDGSLAVAQQFHENGIPVVGVPKTIDNDLSATAFTFGFDSAIECATDALDRLQTTAASHERIMVLEVMGRHTGWIGLHAGIAGGGDIILIPEIPWTWDHLCHKILHRESEGKKFTLVVVAEGAELPGGGLVGEQVAGQQMKLGGVGRAVADEISNRLHRETRLSVLGHLQRGGKPTTFDRVLATQFGAHAVRLVHEQRFGEMICSRPPEMNSVPIMEAVNELRQVDPHGPAVQAARALGISFGDRAADAVGQNVFDREDQLPVSHVPEYVEHHPEDFSSAEVQDESAEPVVVQHVRTPAVTPPASPAISPDILASYVAERSSIEPEIPESTATPKVEEVDVQVEEVIETVLDMAADADEAIHGPVGEVDLPDSITESEPEPEPIEEQPETDAAPASAAARPLDDGPSTMLEDSEPINVAEALIVEPTELPKPKIDMQAAQSQLAERIAAAAQDKLDAAPNSPSLETSSDVSAALVAEEDSDEPEQTSNDPTPEFETEDAVVEDEDLVAQARNALELALAKKS